MPRLPPVTMAQRPASPVVTGTGRGRTGSTSGSMLANPPNDVAEMQQAFPLCERNASPEKLTVGQT
jgi:hypothetical protein